MNIRRFPMIALAGSALFLGSERTFGQDRVDRAPDTYIRAADPAAAAAAGIFAPFKIPSGEGLAVSGQFEVPFWAKLFTDGKFAGTTKYQSSDGSRLLMIVQGKAKVLGAEHTRDVVLTLRPDKDDPKKLRFSGRLIKEVPADVLAAVKNTKGVDAQIDTLLSRVGDSETLGDSPKKPEASLAIDSATENKIALTRLRDHGKRAEPIVLERAPNAMSIEFKGYRLQLAIP